MDRKKINESNRLHGNAFEEIFSRRAQSNGFYPSKIPHAAKFLFKGRIQMIKADLDFRLIRRDGKIGYFDTKTYVDSYFTFSELREDQVKRAIRYNELNVPAGFVVWFRTIDVVVFYSGKDVETHGSGSRFDPSNGRVLGTIQSFDLRTLFGL